MEKLLRRFVFLVGLAVLLFTGSNVFAEGSTVSIHLEVTTGSNSLYNKDISVLPCDSDNDGTIDMITPYCAVRQSGLTSDWNWDWAPGAYVNSIHNIVGYTTKDEGGADVYHYWSWSLNGDYGEVGLNQYELKTGDIISLDFVGYEGGKISNPGGVLVRDEFSIKNAINFLSLNQEEDGSFGNSMYTDWVSIGIAKTKEEKTEKLKSALVDYIKNEKFKGVSITDYERHAMAFMALGINPYDGTDVNYISKIVNSFDGEQTGDKLLINDDIFGLIVLQNAGYDKNDEIILKTISNILKSQLPDGSWGSVDMTSAGIMALDNFKKVDGVNDSIEKAYKFIKKGEKDGNYGNAFSSSWAMQAFSLRDYYSDEVYRTLQFLAHEQYNEDGYIKEESNENRIWATAYAIPAVLNLSWTEIMESFPKQEIELIKETIPPILTVNKKTNVKVLQTLKPETISSNSDTNNITIDSNDSNIKNLFKNKIIIMTIILTMVTFIGGWFVIKS